ncbi:MAG TPA: CBS domain-containing protein [Ktedonosporobacter sp.]|jgi:acetoin utilization protein AcuB|nr:CBS domain-containing protein [Ktedonosporobacter sp.]
MIVRDIMTTKLVTVEPDDTLAHAASLLRQYRFHHLPVTRKVRLAVPQQEESHKAETVLQFEGVLTSHDIDMAAALAEKDGASIQPWQEKRVIEVMHRADLPVTPTTNVASAAQILVERGLNYLPVVEYRQVESEHKAILVGFLTRSDLLMALSRAMGAFEPGMQLDIALPSGNMTALARVLALASELHMSIRSVMAAPLSGSVPTTATIRLGTINPAPLLLRLQEEGIHYSFGTSLAEGDIHG